MDDREERERGTPLLHSGFEYNNRPHRDVFFTVLYSAYMIVMGAFAIYALVDSGDNAKQLWKGDYQDDPSFCNSTDLAIGLTTTSEEDIFTWMDFLKKGWPWMVGAAGGSVIVGILYLELFSRAAVVMVYATIGIAVVVPAAGGIVIIVLYQENIGGGVLIALGFIFFVVMCFARSYLDQVGRLIDCAADGLKYNWELFFFVIILKICLIIYLAFLALFGIAANADGKFTPNPEVDEFDSGSGCFDDEGEQVPCCNWKTKEWVRTYWIFLAILMVWNVFLVFEIKVYVISSVIAEWYFKPEDAENQEGSSRLALSNAFGPSFGSLCFGSLLLTAVAMVKWLLEKLKKENPQNWFMKCLVCFIDCILYTITNITEFATVRMAITGEGFIGAGREVTDMLARNFLSTYSVWVLPPVILGISAAITSLAVGGILASIAYVVFDHANNPQAKTYAILLLIIVFLIIFMVLVFFITLLLNAINAIFVCFAIDRDNKQETKGNVHRVMRELPHMQHLEDNVEEQPKV